MGLENSMFSLLVRGGRGPVPLFLQNGRNRSGRTGVSHRPAQTAARALQAPFIIAHRAARFNTFGAVFPPSARFDIWHRERGAFSPFRKLFSPAVLWYPVRERHTPK
ncbi:hypothetical protein HMPREF0262_02697 [Clostridium sp. ATCC 29733]|nr:hypothetical protein HMPREF0262_02697 [Clostridium sp. ATCC 29733]